MEKKLSVENLVISFKTPGGKVQAVRNISFDLNKGETLAIVGESGSGKSVTSKAILGILAGNSIIEGGSILYDGMDLLKVTEDEFYHIRGDKIAMIFQDPMSSLNPIMRIGKQLTEAMILKGKAGQKSSKKAFDHILKVIEAAQIEAGVAPDVAKSSVAQVRSGLTEAAKKERLYHSAIEACGEALSAIEDVLFHIEKKAFTDQAATLQELLRLAKESINPQVVDEDAEALLALCASVKKNSGAEIRENKEYKQVVADLKSLQAILEKAKAKPVPDYAGEVIPAEVSSTFGANCRKAIAHNAEVYNHKKAAALEVLKKNRTVLAAETPDRSACDAAAKEMIEAVESSIDPIEIHKDGLAYTFRDSITANLKSYFAHVVSNVKAEKEHDAQQRKYDAKVAKGKEPSWKVAPSKAVDLTVLQDTILQEVDRLMLHYEELLAHADKRDFEAEMAGVKEYLESNAMGIVNRVTKTTAKYRALKLMEEVGISDVRRRYKQYPFEFSGGMRQRIVIAIALAADPDILICDEPTTALDVTIQAQILELINKIKKDRNLSIIFITHDLGVVANMADRIAVMYAGKIVETGTSEEIFYSPAHPYTWALLSAMPDTDTDEKLEAIPGTPPNMIYPPVGDAFADRNKYALNIDFKRQPPMFKITETHYAATWLLHPDAPKVEVPKAITDRIERMRKKRGEQNG